MSAINRFVAMIALEESSQLGVEQVVACCRGRFPQFAGVIAPLGKPSDGSLRQLSASEAFNFRIGDVPITLIQVGSPLPPGTLDDAIATTRVWPQANAALSTHKAHIIVAALKEPTNHTDAINLAGAVMSVASAACDAARAIGIYWATGKTVTPADRFQAYTAQLLSGAAPIEVWVQYLWLDGPLSDGQRTLGVMTSGLLPFIGREIEFLPAPLHPRIIADRLTGTISYLLNHGQVINDGDTLGISARERIVASLLDCGDRPGIPVLRLKYVAES